MFAFPVLDQTHKLKRAYYVIGKYGRLMAQVLYAYFIGHYKIVQEEKQFRLPIVPVAYQTQIRPVFPVSRPSLRFYSANN